MPKHLDSIMFRTGESTSVTGGRLGRMYHGQRQAKRLHAPGSVACVKRVGILVPVVLSNVEAMFLLRRCVLLFTKRKCKHILRAHRATATFWPVVRLPRAPADSKLRGDFKCWLYGDRDDRETCCVRANRARAHQAARLDQAHTHHTRRSRLCATTKVRTLRINNGCAPISTRNFFRGIFVVFV